MLRRLAASLLSLSLLTSVSSVALARDFAQPPAAGAPARMQQDVLGDEEYMAPEDHVPSRALLIKALATRRAQNLARFHAYRTRGVYPHLEVPGTKNVWRDHDGHLCAAATLIDQGGHHELVQTTASQQNNVRLGEVTSGPLLDWILASGLTQVEVATIQEPMMRVDRPAPPRDDSWRIAEDARLRKKYARIEATLRANTDDALAQAADRLRSENPALAWAVVSNTLGADAP